MKKLLIITGDEINNENNKELFRESLSFVKSIATKPDLLYAQASYFEYKDGLLHQMLTTYLDNSNRTANVFFDSPTNISTFNKLFPRDTNANVYREIFNTRNGISVSSIRNMPPIKNYCLKVNTLYHFNNTNESICNNFNYVVLHHGSSNLLYYFTTLNQFLYSCPDEQTNFRKLILINKNHLFDNLIEQYKTFTKFGFSRDGIHEKVQVVESLSKCLELLEEDIIYTPRSSDKPFTID